MVIYCEVFKAHNSSFSNKNEYSIKGLNIELIGKSAVLTGD